MIHLIPVSTSVRSQIPFEYSHTVQSMFLIKLKFYLTCYTRERDHPPGFTMYPNKLLDIFDIKYLRKAYLDIIHLETFAKLPPS